MKNQRDINKSYFNEQKKWNIVDRINAELVGPHTHGAKGVDANVNNQKSSNRYDSGQGMELEKQIVNLIFRRFGHKFGERNDNLMNPLIFSV